jgi:hypothetical protein
MDLLLAERLLVDVPGVEHTRPMPQISNAIAGQKKLAPVSAQMCQRDPGGSGCGLATSTALVLVATDGRWRAVR